MDADLKQYLPQVTAALGVAVQFQRSIWKNEVAATASAVLACSLAWLLCNTPFPSLQVGLVHLLVWLPEGLKNLAAATLVTSMLANVAVSRGANGDHPMIPVTRKDS